MFSTTLRVPDDLGGFLQELARSQSTSVNIVLTRLLEEKRELERRRRLALDWAEYAADTQAQDVAYAWPAQAEIAAEPKLPYGVKPPRKPRGKKP